MRSVDKTGERRERAPRDQRQCEQPARAPALHQNRARNLQREITDKKNSAGGAEDRIVQAEIAFHSKRGVSDVGAVEIIRDVEKKQKRQQPPRDSTARTFPGVLHDVDLTPSAGNDRRLPATAR